MDQPPYLPVERRILQEAFAQAHFLGQSDDDMTVALGRQAFNQALAEVLGPPVHATGADSGFAAVRNRDLDVAVFAVKQRYPEVRVAASDQTTERIFDPRGQGTMAVVEATLVLVQKSIQVVAQDSPERALVALLFSVLATRAGSCRHKTRVATLF
jgi:hypothetical protein